MGDAPSILQVSERDAGRWLAPHPESDPEGRDVVFSGQVLAQMIMVATAAAGGDKQVKSIHAVFARAGRYSAGELEMVVDPMHSGRAWASNTVTAMQGDRLLSRGLVLLNTVEPDLMRHSPAMPDVPGPDDGRPITTDVVFPGSEGRMVEGSGSTIYTWVRSPEGYDDVAVNQAIVAWAQPGYVIGAAVQAHPEIDMAEAHRSISTGVIAHTTHFHDPADVSEWLLVVHEGSYAGHGRVFGQGAVFTRDGTLVSTFAQDSMVRRVEGEMDKKSAL